MSGYLITTPRIRVDEPADCRDGQLVMDKLPEELRGHYTGNWKD